MNHTPFPRSSIYHNLRTDKQYKAATKLNMNEFARLYETFEKRYIPKNRNPYLTTNLPVLTHKREALLFILPYYKSYPTLQNLGLYFGFSEFTARPYLDLLKPILKETIARPGLLKSGVFHNQAEFEEAFKGVEEVFIDVTEIPIERPQNDDIQKKRYRGKKNHTLKWLIICDKNKRILFVSARYDGKTPHFAIFKDSFTNLDFSSMKVYVDWGFLGIKKVVKYTDLYLPYKASKKHPLSEIQKELHCALSSIRVVVENSIAKLKSLFILRIENRMRIKSKLDEAFHICAGIANLKHNLFIIKK